LGVIGNAMAGTLVLEQTVAHTSADVRADWQVVAMRAPTIVYSQWLFGVFSP
jgi:hypothetical protein